MDEDAGKTGVPPEIAFDYIKGAFFRVVHADGITGGITPSGNLHMAFFSERGPIPRREVRVINSEGFPGELLTEKSEVRQAIVREVDFDVIMSLRTAEAISDWLQRAVSDLKRATAFIDNRGQQR